MASILTQISCLYGITNSEMLGEAIRRKKGVINKVDQDLDSFIKVVLLYYFVFARPDYILFSYSNSSSLRPPPLEKEATSQQTILSR